MSEDQQVQLDEVLILARIKTLSSTDPRTIQISPKPLPTERAEMQHLLAVLQKILRF